MVLQRKAHLEDRSMPRGSRVTQRVRQLGKWHGVREAVHGVLMHCFQARGKWTIRVDLSTQWHDAGAVAHCLSHRLLRPIGDGRSNHDVLLASPFRQRDLECRKERVEEGCAVSESKLARGVREIRWKIRNQTLMRPRRSRWAFEAVPDSLRTFEGRLPEAGALLNLRKLPVRA